MIEFVEVTKRYGDFAALDGATLEIANGSITGLIGPNGAGKTTSMEIVASLLNRDGGRVRVGGYDPETNAAEVRALVGYMPDFFGVYEGLTSAEYLEFFAAAGGVAGSARRALVGDLLALVDLENKADADVNGLSRGMKQRLSLARALVHDPELLILDEPASGLDPRARVQLRQLIAELSRMNKTVLISSHILAELEGICSHLAVVDDGRVVIQGAVGEIRSSLQGATTVLARVPAEQVEAAETILREQPDVSNLVVERDHLTMTLPIEHDAVAGVLAQLVGRGVAVWEWRIESEGLEDLFLKLTKDGEERGG